MTTPFGLDFGTTNSVVAYFDGTGVQVVPIDDSPAEWATLGFDRVFPSVVGIGRDRELTYGWTAKRQTADKVEAVKRLLATDDDVALGSERFPIEEVTSLLFAGIRRGAAGQGLTMESSVVTIPANSRGVARFRTKLCAGLAGIQVPAFVNEPTAAAMAHSIDADDDQTILVFDWGGGTLDVTVLETVAGVFIELASKGIQRLGGIDVDAAFAAAIIRSLDAPPAWSPEEHALFRLEVERAKVLLSETDSTNLRLPGGRRVEVTRHAFETAVRHLVDQTREPIVRCLADLRIEPGAVDHLVLVGGSTKMPLTRLLVAEWLGVEPASGTDPMTAVAEGAAIAAAILAGQLDKDFFVSTEHALGTVVHDGGTPSFSPLIPRNHKLPAKATGGYTPVFPGQESVLIRVIEGDPDVPIDHVDNVLLKEWTVELDQAKPYERQGFLMTYEYSVDGILHVTVTSDDDGQVMLRDDVSFGVNRDQAALVRMAGRVRQAAEEGALRPPAALPSAIAGEVARVRTKVIPFLAPGEASALESLCAAVETSGGSDDAVRALGAEARKYSYLF